MTREMKRRAFNVLGLGLFSGKRTISMGVVKDDDSDLESALTYHRQKTEFVRWWNGREEKTPVSSIPLDR